MKLLDTDVLIDILRGHPPAIDWFSQLGSDIPGLPGFVVMEIVTGCQNKPELNKVTKLTQRFDVVWPKPDDYNRALQTYQSSRLMNGIGVIDVLIGECAVGLNAILYTFNAKHYKVIPGLRIEQPYYKAM